MRALTAILPMRAGSQRVVDKNIRKINGKPLYDYMLCTLLDSGCVDRIVINTDIREALEKYRRRPEFVLIEREEHLKGNCSMNLVIEDTLNRVEGEHFVQVHATSPLLKPATLKSAAERYFTALPNFDSLFAVTRIQKRFWMADATPVNHNPAASPTTQDLEPYYEENSCFYIFSRSSFFSSKNRIGKKPQLFETSLLESFDIDTEDEFELINKIMS